MQSFKLYLLVVFDGYLSTDGSRSGRSRARRKEYVQELEAKLRSHEQMGIEASTEIQMAARRVLEENKRLRAILRARGVSENEIDATLEQPSAAPALMSMLERQWMCNRISPDNANVDILSETSSLMGGTPVEGASPISIASHAALPRASTEAVGRTSKAHSFDTRSTSTNGSVLPITSQVHDVKTEGPPINGYQSEQNPSNSWIYPSPNYNTDYMPSSYSTSCVSAANIIRNGQFDVGPELEADLGCAPGQDCRVANPVVFHVLEKYSNHAISM
jgi:hypothetical protein